MSLPNRSDISSFDGQNKQNDQNQPPANQPLQWDNTKLGPCAGDVAALGLVSPRAWVRMTLAASSGALVLISTWANWSNATATSPVLGRTTTGVFTITFPAMVSDEYQASFNITDNIAVNLSSGIGNIEGANFGTEIHVSCIANVVTINTGLSGSANDLAGKNIFVVLF